MCKRFALDLDWNAIAAQFSVAEEDVRGDVLPRPSYNIAPTQNIAVIAQGKDGHRHLTGAYWSLIPSWSSGKTLPYPTYNARVESAHVKSTFAESTRSRRTIIPASGYYEWRGRRPFYFSPEMESTALTMAGLYSWRRPSAASLWQLTATILTCPAVDGPATVHDRMPLLVPAGMTSEWLDPSIDGARLLAPMRKAGAELSARLHFHEVAPPEGDGPSLIRPINREEPMRLF